MKKPLSFILCAVLFATILSGCKTIQPAQVETEAKTPSPVIEHSIHDAIKRYLSEKAEARTQIEKFIKLTPGAKEALIDEEWKLCFEDDKQFDKPLEILALCEKQHGYLQDKDSLGNDIAASITPSSIYTFDLTYVDSGVWEMGGHYDPKSDSLQCEFSLDGEYMRTVEFTKQAKGGYAGQVYARYDGDTFYCSRAWFERKENTAAEDPTAKESEHTEDDLGFSAKPYTDEPSSIYQNSQIPVSFVNQGDSYAYLESEILKFKSGETEITKDFGPEEIVSGDFAGAQYDNHMSSGNGELSTDLNLPLTNLIPALYVNNTPLDSADYYFYQPRKKPRYLFISSVALDDNLVLPYEGELLRSKITRKGRNLTISWTKDSKTILEISMASNSTKLQTPTGEIDMGIRPSFRSKTVFMPIYAVLNAVGGGVTMRPSSQEVYHIYSGEPIPEAPIAGMWSNRPDFVSEQQLREGKYQLPKGEVLRVWNFDDGGNCRFINLSFDEAQNKWVLLTTEGATQVHGRILATQWLLCSKSLTPDLASGDWELIYSSLPPEEAEPPVTHYSSVYVGAWTDESFTYKDGAVFHHIG